MATKYDDSGHELDTETDKLDYTKRLKQFLITISKANLHQSG